MKRSNKSAVIVLDAGHGGRDEGAKVKGPSGVVIEKAFTLALVKKIGEQLTAAGHTVVYTRTSDDYPTLAQRLVFVRAQKPSLLISIHGDMVMGSNPSPMSTVSFHVKRPAEKKLAEGIADSLMNNAQEKTTVQSDSYRGSLMMLRESPCPAAMITIGDMPKVSRPEVQTRVVDAIVAGIKGYIA
jgi:N-acetylmuramoyl-L-alanine amidase